MLYIKPNCKSFIEADVVDTMGPMQTTYVELQIYYQQIPQSQAELTTIEKVIMSAENRKPFIYDINNVV
jgi:hypothetical protein